MWSTIKKDQIRNSIWSESENHKINLDVKLLENEF